MQSSRHLLGLLVLCAGLAGVASESASKGGESPTGRFEKSGHLRHAGDETTWCALHVMQREYAEAVEDCDLAIDQSPADADSYSNRSAAYQFLGRLDRAMADLEVAIRLNPIDSKLHFNRGVLHTTLREYLKAIVDYTEAIRLNPKHVPAYFNRGVCLEILGQVDKAIADFREALRLAPSLEEARNKLRRHGEEPAH